MARVIPRQKGVLMVKILTETNKVTVIFDDTPSSTQDFLIDLVKTSYSDGVRVYKEYRKITITFYDGSEGTLKFIDELISIGYGNNDIVKMEVPGLIPINAKVDGIQITGSSKRVINDAILPEPFKYAGLSCTQALVEHGDDALVDMIGGAGLDFESDEEKMLLSNIMSACKNYTLKKYGTLTDEDIFNTPSSTMIDFIYLMKNALASKINDILSRSSFASLDDFIKNADNILLGSAYSALARELVNKFK